VEKIRAEKADYVLGVKKNQPALYGEIKEVTAVTCRYVISNKDAPAEKFGKDIRGALGNRNGPHWMLDVNCREDGCRQGQNIYKKRKETVEPVFGIIKAASNLRFEDSVNFCRRGLSRCILNGIWRPWHTSSSGYIP
jgi:predicted transposase YbfD/YdcC